ncbi:MAG: type II toxin-antitoxin system mRNA interferase toxin, RelE/StbE family [Candidatus Pacebacteria bacterium CG10_big_fil_rev_8_21_14_0_10_42_12]|nr:type II toxin-antitoxin system RelE/ParE family toxin [Candidatus Paceibacterota bacterium]PIR62793.1 MAG: type II toxin-antitoxin system mRNA interferase toxin, RelE/StbE family [Candidatus Pacebacteria bacterium CG10_big_fil_rev_8_21_14_0_10_42_12]
MQIVYLPKTKKHLKKIDKKYLPRIFEAIELLVKTPDSGKSLVGRLHGKRSLKVWPYRVVYSIQPKQSLIVIEAVQHRKDIYR